MVSFARYRSVRCCLIQLYGDLQPANAEPLSIEALAGAIGEALPSTAVDLQTLGSFQTKSEQELLLDTILEGEYDLIGLSCPQGTFEVAISALQRINEHLPLPYILLGNALPTSLPDIFLTHFPQALIVRGWGDAAIVKLCQQIAVGRVQLEQIPSLTYLDQNGSRRDTPVVSREEIAIPLRMEPKRYFARVEASRGCHYNVCTFCSRPPLAPNQPPWRRFASKITLTQVEQLIAAGITTFTFADEDFIGNDPSGALELAQNLCKYGNLDFALSVRADNIINPHGSLEENRLRLHVFQTLREAGLTLVFIGVESFALSQLRRYGKGISPEHSIAAIRLLETLGIELELGLILFDPLLTVEELLINMRVLRETAFWRYAGNLFSFLRPQVGTSYERLLRKHQLLGPLRVNTADYEAIYASPDIRKIAQHCQEWNRQFKHFYMALRNVNRSEVGASYFAEDVCRYRSTQLDFLSMLLTCPHEEIAEFFPVESSWHKKVTRIAQDISFQLSSLPKKTAAEHFLYDVILRLII